MSCETVLEKDSCCVTVTNVSSELYEELLDLRGEKSSPKMTYLDGTLQLEHIDKEALGYGLAVLVEPIDEEALAYGPAVLVEPSPQPDLAEVIHRRLAEVEEGRVQLVDGREVMARARAALGAAEIRELNLSAAGREAVKRLLLAMHLVNTSKLSAEDQAALQDADMIDDDTTGRLPEINKLLIFLADLRL